MIASPALFVLYEVLLSEMNGEGGRKDRRLLTLVVRKLEKKYVSNIKISKKNRIFAESAI